MSISNLDWLGAQLSWGPFQPTIYAILALFAYLVGFVSLGWSARDAWLSRRASREPDADEGERIVAEARWSGTFQRWLAMALLAVIGVLGLFASNPDALPINARRAFGLVLIGAVIGLFFNAERVYWRQRSRLAELVRRELGLRGPPDL